MVKGMYFHALDDKESILPYYHIHFKNYFGKTMPDNQILYYSQPNNVFFSPQGNTGWDQGKFRRVCMGSSEHGSASISPPKLIGC